MKAIVRDHSLIRRLDLTGPERRLGSAVRALGQISERFAKSARKSMPFLTRQKARLVPGDVMMGAPPGAANESDGPGFKVYLESGDGHAWAVVCADTGAIGLVLNGALGGPTGVEIDFSAVFGKELTVAQRALVSRIINAVAEDFAATVKSVAELELRVVSLEPVRAGERLDLPKDAIRVDCTFDGLATAGSLQLYMGAEVLEAAIKARDLGEPVAGDPRMIKAVTGVSVQVVAELGRLELSLGRVLALKKGETLRLSTAVEEPITVRVAGVTKFKAVPVVSRGQLAVQVKQRVTE